MLTVACLLGLFVVVGVLSGCGRQVKDGLEAARLAQDAQDGKFTVKGEKGEEVKVETDKAGKDSGQVKVTDDKGQTTTSDYGKESVKEEDVGIAFYPGAEVQQGVNMATEGGKAGKYATVSLTTGDSFADVAKFYKDKYAAGNTVVEQPDSLMIMIKAGENAGKMVMVAVKDGKTEIMIHSASEKG
jgi:hypothetical protein